MTPDVVSEQELNTCPSCGAVLRHGEVEFLGDGLMVIGVECRECDWYATEEWVHDRTVVNDE
jgi:hypothetical protein